MNSSAGHEAAMLQSMVHADTMTTMTVVSKTLKPWLIALLLLGGCRSGEFTTPDDDLRSKVVQLEGTNASQQRQIAELEARLAALQQRPGALPADVQAAVPELAQISIGRRSHIEDTDDDGRPDQLVVYLQPADGRGRFMQLVGTADLQASVQLTEGAPTTVGVLHLGAGDLRETWRSGFMGTHYTLRCPLDPPPAPGQGVFVTLEFRDARSGLTRQAVQAIGVGQESASSQ